MQREPEKRERPVICSKKVAIAKRTRWKATALSRLVRSNLDYCAFSAAARFELHWEIIADNLSKAGWSWGCVSALDCEGRTIWIADAHREDGKRFVVRADEKLPAVSCDYRRLRKIPCDNDPFLAVV